MKGKFLLPLFFSIFSTLAAHELSLEPIIANSSDRERYHTVLEILGEHNAFQTIKNRLYGFTISYTNLRPGTLYTSIGTNYLEGGKRAMKSDPVVFIDYHSRSERRKETYSHFGYTLATYPFTLTPFLGTGIQTIRYTQYKETGEHQVKSKHKIVSAGCIFTGYLLPNFITHLKTRAFYSLKSKCYGLEFGLPLSYVQPHWRFAVAPFYKWQHTTDRGQMDMNLGASGQFLDVKPYNIERSLRSYGTSIELGLMF